MTINISQKDVAAMKAYKKSTKDMADYYGISTSDMRDALVQFGFAKPTKTSRTYTINLNHDFPNIPTLQNLPDVDDLPVQAITYQDGEYVAVNA